MLEHSVRVKLSQERRIKLDLGNGPCPSVHECLVIHIPIYIDPTMLDVVLAAVRVACYSQRHSKNHPRNARNAMLAVLVAKRRKEEQGGRGWLHEIWLEILQRIQTCPGKARTKDNL